MKQYYYYYAGGVYQSESDRATLYKHILPSDIRDYAKSRGWIFNQATIKDGFYLGSNSGGGRQLNFPVNTDAADYFEAIDLTLKKLAEFDTKPVDFIISEIQELKDDCLRFKVIDDRNEEKYIPLSYAVSAINGAKDLFVSAASTVLKPQAHHPRMNRSEALELIDKSRFRHTERGSFILRVTCPVKAVETQSNLFEENIPFVRQTTLTINKAVSDLVTAIQADTLDNLVDEIKQQQNHFISSNLCKAITNFQEEHEDFDLMLDFKWSLTQPQPQNFRVVNDIKIQRDYFARIDDVRRDLRNTEKQKEDFFVGSVERLDGEIIDGQRAGEVILNLYREDEIIRAKVILDAEQYKLADAAHMAAGDSAYIHLRGKLHTGNQPRLLTDISYFELITR
jgi:hypothetical protein